MPWPPPPDLGGWQKRHSPQNLLEILRKIEAQSLRAGEILHRIRRLTSKHEWESLLFDVNDYIRSVFP